MQCVKTLLVIRSERDLVIRHEKDQVIRPGRQLTNYQHQHRKNIIRRDANKKNDTVVDKHQRLLFRTRPLENAQSINKSTEKPTEVINLSTRELKENEIRVLERSLKFTPPQQEEQPRTERRYGRIYQETKIGGFGVQITRQKQMIL